MHNPLNPLLKNKVRLYYKKVVGFIGLCKTRKLYISYYSDRSLTKKKIKSTGLITCKKTDGMSLVLGF